MAETTKKAPARKPAAKKPPASEAMVTDGYDEIAALQAKLDAEKARADAAEAEAEVAKAEADKYRPTFDVSSWLFENPEDVSARFDKQTLEDIAMSDMAEINKARLKQGLLPIQLEGKDLDIKLDEIKADLVADRDKWVSTQGHATRMLKMVKPVKDACRPVQPCFKHGMLIQVPVEAQINNQAGSLNDGIGRYKDKGYKLPKPFLCAMADCWKPAAVENGKFTHAGYCTEEHRARVEPPRGETVNIITSRNVI